MDFHDTEGLEAFSPDAVEQVKNMRGAMNGPTGVTYELELQRCLLPA